MWTRLRRSDGDDDHVRFTRAHMGATKMFGLRRPRVTSYPRPRGRDVRVLFDLLTLFELSAPAWARLAQEWQPRPVSELSAPAWARHPTLVTLHLDGRVIRARVGATLRELM